MPASRRAALRFAGGCVSPRGRALRACTRRRARSPVLAGSGQCVQAVSATRVPPQTVALALQLLRVALAPRQLFAKPFEFGGTFPSPRWGDFRSATVTPPSCQNARDCTGQEIDASARNLLTEDQRSSQGRYRSNLGGHPRPATMTCWTYWPVLTCPLRARTAGRSPTASPPGLREEIPIRRGTLGRADLGLAR